MTHIHSLIDRVLAISVLTLLAFTGAASQAFAGDDALVGRWKLNPERSNFEPGPAPYQSMTLNFSAAEQGLRNDVSGTDADGRPIQGAYMIVTDGKEHPVTGLSTFDSSSYTPVSDTTTVYVRQKRGATVAVGSRVLSKDGKTLIFREKNVDDLGREKGRALLVFERL